MKQFVCTKCGSIDVFIKANGSQTGLYCGDCGKWIKWLPKGEILLAENWINANSKPVFNKEPNKFCPHCGGRL